MERAAARMARIPGMSARRRGIVEHVFGTLKQWGHGKFLLRLLEKVRGDCRRNSLACNLRRELSLKSVGELLEALPVAG